MGTHIYKTGYWHILQVSQWFANLRVHQNELKSLLRASCCALFAPVQFLM